MPCPEALDRFAVYLDDELETQDGRSLESHLSVCDSCLARARDLAEVHRDLALRSSREEMKSRDPIPAMMARVRWTAAVSRRMRRSRPAESIDPRLLWILVPVAAALLLALFGVDRTPSPRKTPKVEPSPLVEIPPPNIETPAPAPRIAAPSAPDPRTVTPLPRVAVDPPVEAPEPTPKREPAPIVPSTTVPVAPAAIARLEREGRPPRPIALGDTLAEDAPVVVVYPDGMRLFVARDTTLAFEGRGRTVSIARGEVFADVVPQPPEEPVMFSTAGAEVKVVGTWLSVAARPEATVVSVERGRVQVTRKSDRWSLGLREGFTVSVEAGRLPQARPIPSNLLADPGFEAEGKGWEGVFNRLMGRNFGGVSLAPDVFHSGGRSLQLTTQPTFGYDREVYQDFPVAAGDGFEAAGWVRTAGIGVNGVKLSLLWLGTSGSLANDPSTTIRGRGLVVREDVAGIRTGTTEWTRLSTRAAAPPQAKQVRLQIYADVDPGGPATAWVDDLILRRVQKGK
jgi:hypothetical protein